MAIEDELRAPTAATPAAPTRRAGTKLEAAAKGPS